jgi:putative heme-binding domain-containing protein
LDAKSRAAGLRALYWLDWSEIKTLAISALESRSPQAMQTAAIELIGRMEDPAGAEGILENWAGLGPSARLASLETLCSRARYAEILLKAIERGDFESRQLDSARIRMLTEHSDTKVREQAKSLLSSLAPSPRGEVYERYKSALEITADAERGRAAFRKVCAACHRLDDFGNELGPNLAAMRARGPDAILVNVVDPNREVNPQFINYIANTTDGRSITGVMASETATSVTLRRGEGAEDTVLRSDIDEISSTGMSLMPEGLEQQLDQQAMADVIAYLMLVR